MSKVVPIHVRRSPSHSCIIMAKVQEDGTLAIERAIADAGLPPYVADLSEHDAFQTRKALRKGVLDRMRLTGDEFFKQCVHLAKDEVFACQSHFAQTVGDVPDEAQWCASFIEESLYIYLLGMPVDSGCVVKNYALSLPTYDDDGRRNSVQFWNHVFQGSLVS